MAGLLAQGRTDIIEELFTKDKRFQFVGIVGSGVSGVASRIRIVDPTVSHLKDIVVKKSMGGKTERGILANEKNFLTKLRGNLHVVDMVNLPNNPLAGSARADRRDWIILEWLPNGDLRSFITLSRMKLGRGVRLPNRFLWRFFLCLVRMCIGMAWPEFSEELRKDADMSGIVHGDLHQANILLGDSLDDNEHALTPILKVIDFGGAEKYPPEEEADDQNIFDIGLIMMGLINLNRGRVLPADSGEPMYEWRGERCPTEAAALCPCPSGVDDALNTLVCACMSPHSSRRPTLSTLLYFALKGINERTPEYYDNDPREQNAYISRIWKAIVTEPPTAEDVDDEEITENWTSTVQSATISSSVTVVSSTVAASTAGSATVVYPTAMDIDTPEPSTPPNRRTQQYPRTPQTTRTTRYPAREAPSSPTLAIRSLQITRAGTPDSNGIIWE